MAETRADLESKAVRRKLRELAGLAYTRELGAELAKLEAEFSRWRSGEIDPFELSDRIHRFHDGRSRELYIAYDVRNAHTSVARAVAHGILERAEVPADILAALASGIELMSPEECLTFPDATEPADKETTVGGYKVKVTYRPAEGEAATRKGKAVAEILLKSLKNMKEKG